MLVFSSTGTSEPHFHFFALQDSFSAVPRAPGSLFHVLRSQTRFMRYQGCRVPFLSFVLPDSFSTVPRASGPVCMFCVLGLFFGSIEGVGSSFHVLRCRIRLGRYRARLVPFSCFTLPDSFSKVPRALGRVFMFCAPRLFFDGREDVGSGGHVLRSRTYFWWYRWRRVPS
jgi:hypothetical protein